MNKDDIKAFLLYFMVGLAVLVVIIWVVINRQPTSDLTQPQEPYYETFDDH